LRSLNRNEDVQRHIALLSVLKVILRTLTEGHL
jgi:hypothetical protein